MGLAIGTSFSSQPARPSYFVTLALVDLLSNEKAASCLRRLSVNISGIFLLPPVIPDKSHPNQAYSLPANKEQPENGTKKQNNGVQLDNFEHHLDLSLIQ